MRTTNDWLIINSYVWTLKCQTVLFEVLKIQIFNEFLRLLTFRHRIEDITTDLNCSTLIFKLYVGATMSICTNIFFFDSRLMRLFLASFCLYYRCRLPHFFHPIFKLPTYWTGGVPIITFSLLKRHIRHLILFFFCVYWQRVGLWIISMQWLLYCEMIDGCGNNMRHSGNDILYKF